MIRTVQVLVGDFSKLFIFGDFSYRVIELNQSKELLIVDDDPDDKISEAEKGSFSRIF